MSTDIKNDNISIANDFRYLKVKVVITVTKIIISTHSVIVTGDEKSLVF